MSLFNVGDKVTIREDLIEGERYGNDTVADDMLKMCGKTVTIEETNLYGQSDTYKIVEFGFNWTDDMFVETEQKRREKMVPMEKVGVVQFPEINVPERDDTEYIERCVKLEERIYNIYSCRDEEYINYPYKEENVRKANEYSNNQKAKLNALLSRHPNWDAKTHSIVLEPDLYRAINKDEVYMFFNWIKDGYYASIPEATSEDGRKLAEIAEEIKRLQRICNAYECLYTDEKEESNICNISYGDAVKNKDEQEAILCKLKVDNVCPDIYSEKWISRKEFKIYNTLCHFLDTIIINDNCQQFINEEVSEAAKVFEENTEIKLNAVVGRKMSRMINTLCVALGLDKIMGQKQITLSGREEYPNSYNKRYSRFTDAINPLKFTQKTFITTDRIAFITASLGNGWSSCYTPDKTNEDNREHSYEGCYSGGTTSYGSDETTFVLYTISNEYDGDTPVMEDKINRCFFSLGQGKLIQSRNYPDGRDGGDSSLAAQFRAIVQKVICDCYDIPNLWKTKKGCTECASVIYYEGAGYHDHTCYDDCCVSYWKGEDGNGELNPNIITIGAKSVCPNCGRMAEENNCVLCTNCYEDAYENRTHYCADCGCHVDEDDGVEIDGVWYCTDCAQYCDYHDEWEHNDTYYIESYGGNVCQDAIDYSGDFACCEQCGETIYRHGSYIITAEDGNVFCDTSCAERSDYVLCDDDNVWRHIDYADYCEECDRWVAHENWDDEHEMCKECAKQLTDEEEEVA